MKKILFCTIVIILFSSQSRVINVDNKEKSSNERPDIGYKGLIETKKGKVVLPRTLYIKSVADFYTGDSDQKELLKATEEFLNRVNSGEGDLNLDDEFSFMFNTLYGDSFKREFKRWYISKPYIENNFGEVDIEILREKDILLCTLYLILDDSWKIIDFQVEEKEKGSFDPKSPILY